MNGEGDQSGRFIYASRITRLKLLQEMSTNMDFYVPAFLFLSHEEATEERAGDIAKFVGTSLNGSPICRPCPVDEIFSPGLSFAGIFPTYIPNQKLDLDTNIRKGVKKVCEDDLTGIDYYYNTHREDILLSTKERHLIMMELIRNPIIHGTAYVYSDLIRSCYSVKPKSFTGEINLHVLSFKPDSTERINLSVNADREIGDFVVSRIMRPLTSILTVSKVPIDIEYLIDGDQKLWVVQARPISDAHLRLYQQVNSLNQQQLTNVNDSALFNSCGSITGKIYDMRNLGLYAVDKNRFIDKNTILLTCHQRQGFFRLGIY